MPLDHMLSHMMSPRLAEVHSGSCSSLFQDRIDRGSEYLSKSNVNSN